MKKRLKFDALPGKAQKTMEKRTIHSNEKDTNNKKNNHKEKHGQEDKKKKHENDD